MARLRRLQTRDPELSELQKNVAEVVDPLAAIPWMGGILLQGVSLGGMPTLNQVQHQLGREPMGWWITRKTTFADIHDDQANEEHRDKFLRLRASESVAVDLWVF